MYSWQGFWGLVQISGKSRGTIKTETQINPWQGREKCSIGTNLINQGLISADRNNKATLLLTIPSSLFKSSAKDLSSPIFEIIILQPCV